MYSKSSEDSERDLAMMAAQLDLPIETTAFVQLWGQLGRKGLPANSDADDNWLKVGAASLSSVPECQAAKLTQGSTKHLSSSHLAFEQDYQTRSTIFVLRNQYGASQEPILVIRLIPCLKLRNRRRHQPTSQP